MIAWSPKEELDLALLEILDPPAHLPTVAFADPDDVEIGDEVVAIGHPEQGGLWTLTTGAVSTVIANYDGSRGRMFSKPRLQWNRGNSGGPLLDSRGNMIGVNTLIARKGAGGITITDVNFSLKSSVAVKWMAGQGLGLAYAPNESKNMVVAVAPQAGKACGSKWQKLQSSQPNLSKKYPGNYCGGGSTSQESRKIADGRA